MGQARQARGWEAQGKGKGAGSWARRGLGRRCPSSSRQAVPSKTSPLYARARARSQRMHAFYRHGMSDDIIRGREGTEGRRKCAVAWGGVGVRVGG